ncbi:MAG: hypothetical protein ABIQ55_11370 [Gemmatimonadaceae bacterium]
MPDNAVYYHLAYAVAAVIYIAYSVRLAAKWNKVRTQRTKSGQ